MPNCVRPEEEDKALKGRKKSLASVEDTNPEAEDEGKKSTMLLLTSSSSNHQEEINNSNEPEMMKIVPVNIAGSIKSNRISSGKHDETIGSSHGTTKMEESGQKGQGKEEREEQEYGNNEAEEEEEEEGGDDDEEPEQLEATVTTTKKSKFLKNTPQYKEFVAIVRRHPDWIEMRKLPSKKRFPRELLEFMDRNGFKRTQLKDKFEKNLAEIARNDDDGRRWQGGGEILPKQSSSSSSSEEKGNDEDEEPLPLDSGRRKLDDCQTMAFGYSPSASPGLAAFGGISQLPPMHRAESLLPLSPPAKRMRHLTNQDTTTRGSNGNRDPFTLPLPQQQERSRSGDYGIMPPAPEALSRNSTSDWASHMVNILSSSEPGSSTEAMGGCQDNWDPLALNSHNTNPITPGNSGDKQYVLSGLYQRQQLSLEAALRSSQYSAAGLQTPSFSSSPVGTLPYALIESSLSTHSSLGFGSPNLSPSTSTTSATFPLTAAIQGGADPNFMAQHLLEEQFGVGPGTLTSHRLSRRHPDTLWRETSYTNPTPQVVRSSSQAAVAQQPPPQHSSPSSTTWQRRQEFQRSPYRHPRARASQEGTTYRRNF